MSLALVEAVKSTSTAAVLIINIRRISKGLKCPLLLGLIIK